MIRKCKNCKQKMRIIHQGLCLDCFQTWIAIQKMKDNCKEVKQHGKENKEN